MSHYHSPFNENIAHDENRLNKDDYLKLVKNWMYYTRDYFASCGNLEAGIYNHHHDSIQTLMTDLLKVSGYKHLEEKDGIDKEQTIARLLVMLLTFLLHPKLLAESEKMEEAIDIEYE